MCSRVELSSQHVVAREPLSVRAHMSRILECLGGGQAVAFVALIDTGEGRLGVVVSFLAVLELVREALVIVEQDAPYASLALRTAAAAPKAHHG
jgi:segregation and condensation protein A